MGKSKAKRGAPTQSRQVAPAIDFSTVAVPPWAGADICNDGLLDELAQRTRSLLSALHTATRAVEQLDALRNFKGTMHAWMPRKRRQPALKPTQEQQPQAPPLPQAQLAAEGCTSAVQVEDLAFNLVLTLYALPAAGHALLRPTLKGILEAVAEREPVDEACAALNSRALGSTTQPAVDSEHEHNHEHEQRRSNAVAAALSLAARLHAEATSKLADLRCSAADSASASTSVASPSACDAAEVAEQLLSSSAALLELRLTRCALAVRGPLSEAAAAPAAASTAARHDSVLSVLLQVASCLLQTRGTALARSTLDESDRSATLASAAAAAVQRILPVTTQLLQLQASQPGPCTDAQVIETVGGIENACSSILGLRRRQTSVENGVGIGSESSVHTPPSLRRLNTALDAAPGLRTQAGLCVVLAVQVGHASKNPSAFAQRLHALLCPRREDDEKHQDTHTSAAVLALARASVGTLPPEALLHELRDESGAVLGTMLGRILPDVGISAAAAPTARERIDGFELLRVWLTRVQNLCRSDAMPLSGLVTTTTLSRFADITSTALRSWGHPNAKLAKLVSVVLATTAATELLCGAGKDDDSRHNSMLLAGVLSRILAQPPSSKPKYAALTLLAPHICVQLGKPGPGTTVLNKMFDAMADGSVAAAAAAVVTAMLRCAFKGEIDGTDAKQKTKKKKKNKSKQKTSDHTDDVGGADGTQLVSRCRALWVPRIATVLLRSVSSQAALPALLRFDNTASYAVAAELRRQAKLSTAATIDTNLLQALLAVFEAHARTGAKRASCESGNVIEWCELRAAAVHSLSSIRMAALSALLRCADDFTSVHSATEADVTHQLSSASLPSLPSRRAMVLFFQIVSGELMIAPILSSHTPLQSFALPPPVDDQGGDAIGRASAQEMRATLNSFLQRLVLVEQAAQRICGRTSDDNGDATATTHALEVTARIGEMRATITKIALNAVLSPSAFAMPPCATKTGYQQLNVDGGNPDDVEGGSGMDVGDGDDDEDGAQAAETADGDGTALTTALETLVVVMKTWVYDADTLKPALEHILNSAASVDDGDEASIVHPVSRRAFLLLAHGRPRVRALAHQFLVALPKHLLAGVAPTVLTRCIGGDGFRGGLAAAPRRAEAEAAASAVAILHRHDHTSTRASAALSLLEFVTNALEVRLAQLRAYEDKSLTCTDEPPLIHGLFLCLRRAIGEEIAWESVWKEVSALPDANATWRLRQLVVRALAAVGEAMTTSLRVVAENGTDGGASSGSDSEDDAVEEGGEDRGAADGSAQAEGVLRSAGPVYAHDDRQTARVDCRGHLVDDLEATQDGEEASAAARVAGAWVCVGECASVAALLLQRLLPLLPLTPPSEDSDARPTAQESAETMVPPPPPPLLVSNLAGGLVSRASWDAAMYSATSSALSSPNALLMPEEAGCVLRLLLRAQLRLKHMGALASVEAALQTAVEAVLLLGVRLSRHSASVDAHTQTSWETHIHELLELPHRMIASLCRGLGTLPAAASSLLPPVCAHAGSVSKKTSQQRFLLRRSAGFASAFLALTRAEPSSVPPVLLATAVQALLAASAPDSAWTEECAAAPAAALSPPGQQSGSTCSWRRRVHAMNVLRLLCRDGRLGHDLLTLRVPCPALKEPGTDTTAALAPQQALPCALVLAIQAFADAHWAVRNSALMLFAAVSQRSLGGNRMTDSSAGKGVGVSADSMSAELSDTTDAGKNISNTRFPTAAAFLCSFPLLRRAWLALMSANLEVLEQVSGNSNVALARSRSTAAALYPLVVLLAQFEHPADGDDDVRELRTEAGMAEAARWLHQVTIERGGVPKQPKHLRARDGGALWRSLASFALRAAASADALLRVTAARALPAALPPCVLPCALETLSTVITDLSRRFIASSADAVSHTGSTNELHGRLLQLVALLRAARTTHGGVHELLGHAQPGRETATCKDLRGALANAGAVSGAGFGGATPTGVGLGGGGGCHAGSDGACCEFDTMLDVALGTSITPWGGALDSVGLGTPCSEAGNSPSASLTVSAPAWIDVLCGTLAALVSSSRRRPTCPTPEPIADAALQAHVELFEVTAAWSSTVRNSMANAVSDAASCTLRNILGECGDRGIHGGNTFAAHGSVLGERSMATLAGLTLLPPPLVAHKAPAFDIFLQSVRTCGSCSDTRSAAVPMRRAALAAACNMVRHLCAALPSVRMLHSADRADLLNRLCGFRRTLLDVLPTTAAAILEAQARAETEEHSVGTRGTHNTRACTAWRQQVTARVAPTLALELRILLELQRLCGADLATTTSVEEDHVSALRSLVTSTLGATGTGNDSSSGGSGGGSPVVPLAGGRALLLLAILRPNAEYLLPLVRLAWATDSKRAREAAAAALHCSNLLGIRDGDAVASVRDTLDAWTLALEMLLDAASPAATVRFTAAAVCRAARSSARTAIADAFEAHQSLSASAATHLAIAQLGAFSAEIPEARHLLQSWLLDATRVALGLSTTSPSATPPIPEEVAQALTASVINFARRRRLVYEPSSTAAAAAAAAVAAAGSSSTSMSSHRASVSSIAASTSARLSDPSSNLPTPLSRPARTAASAIARLCLPSLAPMVIGRAPAVNSVAAIGRDEIDDDSADVRDAANVCTNALRLLRLLVTWISSSEVGDRDSGGGIGGNVDEDAGFPPLRQWLDEPGSIVSHCPSWHPPLFAVVAVCIIAARTLLPVTRANYGDDSSCPNPQLDTEVRAMRTTLESSVSARLHMLTGTHPLVHQQLKQLKDTL